MSKKKATPKKKTCSKKVCKKNCVTESCDKVEQVEPKIVTKSGYFLGLIKNVFGYE
jgi:rRNA processing protein Gar1